MPRNNKKLTQLFNKYYRDNEQAATVVEGTSMRRRSFRNIVVLALLKNKYMWASLLVLLVILLVPFAAWKMIQGSTYQEQKGSLVERIQNLNELTTAEAFTKVIIEKENNELFGKEIGIDLPGTKRELLVVVPGGVKAGVDFEDVSEKNVKLDQKNKEATITLPAPKILGEPEVDFDNVQVFSSEGLFRNKPDMKEAFGLTAEAKREMIKEAKTQGLLSRAKSNAKNSVADMFALVGYDVTVKFKE
ncbi:DUF4230 domain-containing protein [Rummeliibacillus sp. TYF-LIM-RU47]|uniref:DUF4230 domain-containing protein n=1 Tax=unclassified Rummeliibacillus TaxID=2622809 RepID=UPI0016809328|nr:DUF4230 domain-containing protein [Rummeliibacillus sp. TYF-LIM-RU47]